MHRETFSPMSSVPDHVFVRYGRLTTWLIQPLLRFWMGIPTRWVGPSDLGFRLMYRKDKRGRWWEYIESTPRWDRVWPLEGSMATINTIAVESTDRDWGHSTLPGLSSGDRILRRLNVVMTMAVNDTSGQYYYNVVGNKMVIGRAHPLLLVFPEIHTTLSRGFPGHFI